MNYAFSNTQLYDTFRVVTIADTALWGIIQ